MFLGLDLGTGSIKAMLLSADGTELQTAFATYPIATPQPGWAESDTADWWMATQSAVAQLQFPRDQLQAIGLSGQMHSLVLCDATGTPLRPAILWADGRSLPQLEAYRALNPALLRPLGNPLVAGMTGPSLLWIKTHEPDVYEAARHALQPKDWLRLRLTAEIGTDPSDASATLLYNLERDTWAQEVVEGLGLRPELMAGVSASTEASGRLTPTAAAQLGLQPGLPVASGAGDTAAAILGSGLHRADTGQLTIGTGVQLVVPCAQPNLNSSFGTHCYRSACRHGWYAMSAMQNGGLALEGARRMLGLTWDEAYEEAFSVESDGAYFVPYLSGERTPHLDASVRGGWLGLGLQHGRAQLMRAAFEGVAFSIRAGLEALWASSARLSELRLAGGGTLDPRWRQLLADSLGLPLYAVDVVNASARGAALLGAVAHGTFTEHEALVHLAPDTTLVAEPNLERSTALLERYKQFSQLYPRLRGWTSS